MNHYAQRDCPIKLRRVGYRDPETGKHYVFLTNHIQASRPTPLPDFIKRVGKLNCSLNGSNRTLKSSHSWAHLKMR